LDQQYALEPTASAVTPQALAWHFTQAGAHARAVSHLRAAGQGAIATHAHVTAVDLLTRALALTPPDDHSVRFELLVMREHAHALLRDLQARAQDLGELDAVCRLPGALPVVPPALPGHRRPLDGDGSSVGGSHASPTHLSAVERPARPHPSLV
jgi:hypothetical protein